MNRKVVSRVGTCALLFATGLVVSPTSASFASLQPGIDQVTIGQGEVASEKRILKSVPKLDPAWRPPALPLGSVAAEVIGSPAIWMDPEIDYPREAQAERREGTATVGFTIDITGHAGDCVIVKTSGDHYLDTGSCALVVARGRFKPAYDAGGLPLASAMTLPIVWRLDWDVLRPPTESLLRLQYVIRESGALEDCWTDRGEGTEGISHPEVCVGAVPSPLIELMRTAAGPGDIEVQTITGHALSDSAMAAQIANRPGWHRVLGSAAWYVVDETGIAGDCQRAIFPGVTEFEDDTPCSLSPPKFAPPVGADGQPAKTRLGKSIGYYVRAKTKCEDSAANGGSGLVKSRCL